MARVHFFSSYKKNKKNNNTSTHPKSEVKLDMKHNQSQEHMWTKVINAMWEIVTHPPKKWGTRKKFPKRRLHTYEYLFQLLCPKWAGPGFNSPTLGTFQGQLSSVSHELLNLSKLSLPAVWPPSNAILLPSSLLAMTITNDIITSDRLMISVVYISFALKICLARKSEPRVKYSLCFDHQYKQIFSNQLQLYSSTII